MNRKRIRKAVIPAAGLGTRVLPATKAQPKEMLVIVDKPALQYLVEELVESGIEEILIVTGRNKESIENHFDYSYELEKTLEEKGKIELLKVVNNISKLSNIYYVRQKNPLGLGHAIGCAEAFVGDEPFVVLLGDDIIYTDEAKGEVPVTKQLINKYNELNGGTILGVQEVPEKEVDKYGIIDPLSKIDDKTVEVENFVEKPSVEEAPSRLAALGRYVLEPEIFKYLKETKPGKGGEIQLTDAILKMKNSGNKLYAYNFDGLRYDTGDKLGMFIANVEFGLRHPELKDKAKEYLKKLIEKLYTITPILMKTDEGYWQYSMTFEDFEKRLKINCLKKYLYFTQKSDDLEIDKELLKRLGENKSDDIDLFTNIKFINKKPITIIYKGRKLVGDKVELQIANNERAQDIAYMLLGTGLLENCTRGCGFLGFKFYE